MSTDTTTSLRLTRVIKASRERVFSAWTLPDQMKRWAGPEGVTVVEAHVDLKIGGDYHIHMRSDDGTEYNARGTYQEVDPPNRLVYSWGWDEKEHDVGETLVTVEFIEMSDATEIVLTHERFPGSEARDDHDQGWVSCLNRLEALFE